MQAIMLDAHAKVPARAPTHNRTAVTYGRNMTWHRSSSMLSCMCIACHAAGRLSLAEAATRLCCGGKCCHELANAASSQREGEESRHPRSASALRDRGDRGRSESAGKAGASEIAVPGGVLHGQLWHCAAFWCAANCRAKRGRSCWEGVLEGVEVHSPKLKPAAGGLESK